MTNLQELDLGNNQIADIDVLALNAGLGEGDYVNLLGNPFSEQT